jgi:hypothetical protein
MGITVAPGTGSIMAAVPLNKAGVGSAVNDTTREVGGALGIAILGSIANSTYRSNIDEQAIGALPGPAADIAEESIGGALQVAAQAPSAELGTRLVDTAQDAFVTATSTTFIYSAALAALAGVAVFVTGRGYRPTPPSDAPGADTTAEVRG